MRLKVILVLCAGAALLASGIMWGAYLILCAAGIAILWIACMLCRDAWHRIRSSAHERYVRKRDATTESPLEQMLAAELDLRGISYEREYLISHAKVDFAFPAARLAVECDGWRYHHDRKAQDAARDMFLQRKGWKVLRFTGDQLRSDVGSCADMIQATVGKLPMKRS
jgi:very-short-patch-repair endonuclease